MAFQGVMAVPLAQTFPSMQAAAVHLTIPDKKKEGQGQQQPPQLPQLPQLPQPCLSPASAASLSTHSARKVSQPVPHKLGAPSQVGGLEHQLDEATI